MGKWLAWAFLISFAGHSLPQSSTLNCELLFSKLAQRGNAKLAPAYKDLFDQIKNIRGSVGSFVIGAPKYDVFVSGELRLQGDTLEIKIANLHTEMKRDGTADPLQEINGKTLNLKLTRVLTALSMGIAEQVKTKPQIKKVELVAKFIANQKLKQQLYGMGFSLAPLGTVESNGGFMPFFLNSMRLIHPQYRGENLRIQMPANIFKNTP